MSVILDALKKAQDERKRPSYRDGSGDDGPPRRPKWVFYCIVGAAVCAILLVLFLPELYKMQAPGPQVTARKDAPPPPPPPPAPAKAAPEVAPGKEPQVPGKEEFSKYAMEPAKVAPGVEPRVERKMQKQSATPEAGIVKPKPETAPEKTAAPPAKVAEAKTAPPAPPEDATVVVKRVTTERITTNYNNALLEAERGRTEEAKKLYMAVLADQPGHIEALNNLGVIAMREGNNKEAISYFRRILDYRKDYAKAYNNLGIVMMREGDKKMAEEYFRKAGEVAPDSVEPYLNLAALLRSEKRLEEANRVTEAAIRRGYREPALLLSTALIKDELGQHEEAIKYYRAYLQSSQQKENRKSIVERLTFLEENQSATNR